MYFKNKLSIYIAKNELLYVILKAKKPIYGEIPLRSYDGKNRDKEIITHMISLSKKHKARGVIYAVEQGSKVTKVIQKDMDLKKMKPKAIEGILSKEVKDILNQNEQIKNFLINYSIFDDTFLVSTYSKSIIESICKTYVDGKVNLEKVTVPEEALFNIILNQGGVCALFYFDGLSLKTVVSADGKPLFVKKDERNDETILSSIISDISDVKDYILMKTDREIQSVYLAGEFPEPIGEIVTDAETIVFENDIPSKYAVTLGNLMITPKK